MKRKLLLALVAALLPLVLAELSLRVSSRFYRAALLQSRAQSLDEGAARVLCVGDSNTFGVRVAAERSYPGQLEALLNAGAARRRYQVVNRGVPGKNTAQILADLEAEIAEVEPRVLLVLAGINNSWNVAAAQRGHEARWYDHLRLVKLARIALNDLRAGERAASGAAAEPEIAAIERADRERGRAERPAITRDDLVAIAELARGLGVVPVLQTYAGHHPHMEPFNAAAREAAAATGALLIDHDARFGHYIGEYGYGALFFEDSHPAEAGYELFARDVVRALSAAGLIEGVPPPPDGPPRFEKKDAVLALERDAAGRPAALLLEGEPGAGFQVYASPLREPELDLGSRKVPVGVHPWLDICRSFAPFRGTLDAGGRARVPLPEQVAALPAGEVLYAAFVTLDPRPTHERAVRSISAAVEVRR